jgi:hypothetical protein
MEASAAMVEIDTRQAHTGILQGPPRDHDQPRHWRPTRTGWLNTDYEPLNKEIVFVDVTKRFPFPEQSVDYFHTEHMIEHVPSAILRMILKQWS